MTCRHLQQLQTDIANYAEICISNRDNHIYYFDSDEEHKTAATVWDKDTAKEVAMTILELLYPNHEMQLVYTKKEKEKSTN